MYKVIIVDDEKWIVESLKRSIKWSNYGFEVIGEAFDGIDAYKKIEQLSPDVIFTDIRMPKMNGLELIKRVNESSLNIPIIVISGHAEFAYVQKALNYGAIGYCLKPFDEVEIIAMLEKTKQILKKVRTDTEAEFIDILEESNNENEEYLKRMFTKLGVNINEQEGVLILISIGQGELTFPEDIRHFMLKSGVNKRIYFVHENDMPTKEFLVQQLSDDIKSIGTGSVIHQITEMKKALEDTYFTAYQFFINGQKGVYEVQTVSRDSNMVNAAFRALDESIHSKDIGSIGKAFDIISEYFMVGMCNIKHAFYLYQITVSLLYGHFDNNQEKYLLSFGQLEKYFGNVQNMIKYLKDLINEKLNTKPDHTVEMIKNNTCKSILKYVNNNFYKDISIQTLAQEFFINPTYIGQLFKKEVGKTLIEYLTGLRIDYACELLKKKDLSIGEIAEKVGYDDYFYFSKIFKKVNGKTPTQYREG